MIIVVIQLFDQPFSEFDIFGVWVLEVMVEGFEAGSFSCSCQDDVCTVIKLDCPSMQSISANEMEVWFTECFFHSDSVIFSQEDALDWGKRRLPLLELRGIT